MFIGSDFLDVTLAVLGEEYCGLPLVLQTFCFIISSQRMVLVWLMDIMLSFRYTFILSTISTSVVWFESLFLLDVV